MKGREESMEKKREIEYDSVTEIEHKDLPEIGDIEQVQEHDEDSEEIKSEQVRYENADRIYE